MSDKPSLFRVIGLRVLAAMVAVVAGLCLVVTVLAAVVWAKGGSEADGMPALTGGFFAGFLLCLAAFWMVRRRSVRVEALLDEPAPGQVEGT
ncbi:hypothetical protein [Calidifontibacter indicus]|uniref:hypothetical protein n=1 Tax=Calidifontibacter indicus TaxID=419650 RepID=UPI003D755E63